MARVIRRVAVKRDLIDHFVFLGENASIEVARRFLHASNLSFEALAHMPELGAPRAFRNPRFSSVRAWPVKGFERYLNLLSPAGRWRRDPPGHPRFQGYRAPLSLAPHLASGPPTKPTASTRWWRSVTSESSPPRHRAHRARYGNLCVLCASVVNSSGS